MKEAINIPCINFRRDDSHFPHQQNQEFWQGGEPATGHYWCLQTMTTSGPDSQIVSPEKCTNVRKCYLKEELR